VRLRTRLQLFGAVIPALFLIGAFGLGGMLFRRQMLESIDRALLAQAAVETVSLFDGDEGDPHLHLAHSPMRSQVQSFAASGAIYGQDGALVATFPEDLPVARHVALQAYTPTPSIHTEATAYQGRVRALLLRVTSPGGEPYALRLAVSLHAYDAAVRLYFQSAGIMVLFATSVLLALQVRQAHRLEARIQALARHMSRVRRGDLEGRPPPDAGTDVIARLRDEIADATEKLQAARDSQERLLADAAHELRTPLALMKTEIDLALRKQRSEAELRDALQHTRGEVDRLTSLAARLLDLTSIRQVAWDARRGDLRALLDEAADGYRTAAEERGIEVRVIGLERAEATFNAGALRQAVDNLLSNALKFSPRNAMIELALEADARSWRIVVRDEGPGIPEGAREAVFAPFHRLDQRKEGSGLGLAIVRDVAQRHGGRAYVRSGTGAAAGGRSKGAELVIELPREPAGEMA
jgi:signal transduction histidine kinase